MRHQGKITQWKDERGFGFITPKDGGARVFVHIRSFVRHSRRPTGGETVTYELMTTGKGQYCAEDVAIRGQSLVTATAWIGELLRVLPALGFLLLLAGMVWFAQLPLPVFGAYLGASTLTFLAYWRDKSAAENKGWRISENSLHLFSLLGGWPGALLAQRLLRHKSIKRSFLIIYAMTVVLNCCVLAALFFAADASMQSGNQWFP